VEPDTGLVATANVAPVAPAATVTLDGTVAAEGLSLDSDSTAPPGGAGPLSVTVPVDEAPPATAEGLTASSLNVGGGSVTVSTDVLPTPL